MSAGVAQTKMAFAQMSTILEESREETPKHFDNVRLEVSVRLGEVYDKMNNIKAEINSERLPPACPPGWERPSRSIVRQAPASQFGTNFMGGCGGSEPTGRQVE